jgi:hypothetical protein
MRSSRLLRAGLILALSAAPAAAEVVERILAVVDSRPVLLSEVRLVQLLRNVDQGQATQVVIDERLMFREATRVPQASVDAEEEERAYQSLEKRLPDLGQAPEAELRRLGRREATILKYLEFRFRSQVRAGEDEIRAAYAEKYAADPAAPPFEQMRAALAEQVEARKFDERIEAWVKELRAGAEIRLNP